ncbi:hypothetical protein C7B65_25890 [Phormidesmis priestleyi ULC007]|uniref:Uncharacterized protein n=1 Tax=Phormidesmis priestleyi ULC007 TaxID=1920490 RepID=A0A2T1D2N1_9CYAN|nr:hypothetical protein [Phormidesmis priestleyi]PSB14753.1 hypothetical protein C7B65_25890 [Phormidesmis priestleyi ULC007]
MVGFGKPKQDDDQKLIDRMVRHCWNRNPKALDRLLDSLHVGHPPRESERLSYVLTQGTLDQIQSDLDTLSWFCGYMCDEINTREDGNQPLPITQLAKKLIEAGMQPFEDFVPYPGRRLVIINDEKAKSLPETLQAELEERFELRKTSSEELQQINEAIREELRVTESSNDE